MNYLIYDCEIIRCIPDRSGELDDSYQYCAGWSDHANMGVSVIGCYSSWTNDYGYISQDTEPSYQEWAEIAAAQHDLIIGFNSRNFDDRLLAANGISISTGYDLLEEVRIAAGFKAHHSSVPKGFSYSLDVIARANGMAKTGSGTLAPQLWQQGKHQEVIDYCLHDVRITHELLKLGLDGRLRDPNTGVHLELRQLG